MSRRRPERFTTPSGSHVVVKHGPVIRYQDPTAPKLVRVEILPRCRICGHVPRYATNLDETWACKGKVNCAERASWRDDGLANA